MLALARYALRQLRRTPGFALTAVSTLALGIGATTAIFALLDAVLLDPLPFPQPERLVAVASQPDGVVSIPTMQDYQSRSTAFLSLGAYRQWSPHQKSDGPPSANRILIVSQQFLSTLGAHLQLGTSWPVTGNERECPLQAVVSGAYWNRLGGGGGLGSKTLNLDGRDFQIVGVLGRDQEIEGSYALNRPEVFLPIGCDADEHPEKRGSAGFELIGRLRPGMTPDQAYADLMRVDATLEKDYPNYYGASRAAFRKPTAVFPYLDLVTGAETKPALWLTLAACALLLLIACFNLANLLFARNTRRRAEFAIRAALGASQGNLLRQLIVESAVLVAAGAACGITLAWFAVRLLKAVTALRLPRLAHAALNSKAMLFTIGISCTVTLFLALLPALRTLKPSLLLDLGGAGKSSASAGLRLTGRLLVVAQITLSLVLLACAGWMIGGVTLLLHQPLGFTPDRLLMARVSFDSINTAKDAARQTAFSEIAATLRQLPEVSSVALTDHPPLGHAVNRYTFCSDTHPEQCKQEVNLNPNSYAVSSSYFSTISQPLLEGRDFNAADDGRNHVAIVNAALASREWPGVSALGHRVHTGEIKSVDGESWATVIGVVGNVRNYDLASAPGPDLYIPRAEDPSLSARFLLRAQGNPAAFKNLVRSKVKSQFPEAVVNGIETIEEEMSSEVSERVFLMQVAIAFGAVALLISIVGTYGLLAYEVALREKEIGIRLALGSSRERIVLLLLHQEGRWLAAGAALGLASAGVAGYALRSRFYGAEATSFAVLAGSALLLIVPALFAILLPARRAALLDPAGTLRRE